MTETIQHMRELLAKAKADLASEKDAKHRALTCAADYAERAEADNREINRLANIVADDGERIAALTAQRDKALADLTACRAKLAAERERREKAEYSQRITQKAREDDRGSLQQKCSDWGTYWRASDAHGVKLNIAQATELLMDALGVEVEIEDAALAELENSK